MTVKENDSRIIGFETGGEIPEGGQGTYQCHDLNSNKMSIADLTEQRPNDANLISDEIPIKTNQNLDLKEIKTVSEELQKCENDNKNKEVNNNNGDDHIKQEVHVYATRFWILGVFSYTAFMVIVIWGTFGPILESAEYAFGWEDGFIALLESFGPIFSIICMFPFNWATEKFGLRLGMLLVSFLITVSTGIRCISFEDTAFTYLVSVGAIFTGMASCLTLSLPPMLSSVWFPKEERATATAVGALATQLACAGMYLAPLVVRTPEEDVTTKDDIKGDIKILMFIHFGLSLLSFLCTLIYFPKAPPKPPSVSSSVERTNYFKSIKILIRNKNVMFVAICYVFSFSIPICWVSVMNFSFECLGISQDQTMWIGIAACSISPLLAFIVARVTDYIYGYLKISIMILYVGASGFFLWLFLITEKIITASIAQVAIAVICAISLQYATVPLLIELAVELAYPCPESVVGGLVSIMLDSCDGVFLLLMIIPSECYRWLSYALLGCCSLTLIPMFFVKEIYYRADVDRKLEDKSITPTKDLQNPS